MQTVIFDFFGVVVSEIAPFVLPKYMSATDVVRYRATVVQEADLGYITQKEFFDRLSIITHVPARALEEEFWTHVKVNYDTIALIESLRHKYRVALLTNAIVPFVRQIMAKHDLAQLFDTIMVSSEEHMAKPDPAFFQLLLDKMQVVPKDAFFIDDNPTNIEGARNAGIAGIVFTSASQVTKDLSELYAVRP